MTNEEMFNKNVNLAYKLANKYKDNYLNEYEDIKQAALYGLWKAVINFNGKHAFSTFAYPVISNEINYYLRRYHKKEKGKIFISIYEPIRDTEGLFVEDTIKDEYDCIEKIINKITFYEIQELINNIYLKDHEKKVFYMTLNEITQKEIAKELGLSQAHVSRIMKKIIKKLKQIYSERRKIDEC